MLRRCANVTAATAAKYARTASGAGSLVSPSHARAVAPQLVHSWVAAAFQAPVASLSCNRGVGQMRNMSSTPGMVDVDADRAPINVTERCAKRIHKVVKENGGFLRLRVDGGGCSGFQYKFIVDSEPEEDDITIERDGAKVVVDESSLEFVKGATLDFVEEMISSSFQVVNNPQSESSCGCGTSFAPKA